MASTAPRAGTHRFLALADSVSMDKFARTDAGF